MLRINKDGTIPTDNPFYATASGNNRAIWALGLRNPFKFAVQPGTGTIFINDVGAEHLGGDKPGCDGSQLWLEPLRGQPRQPEPAGLRELLCCTLHCARA